MPTTCTVCKKNVQRAAAAIDRNKCFIKEAGRRGYKGILDVTSDPVVSSDIIKNSCSCVIDLSLTRVVDGNLVKVVAWYDNEWGYANRLVELALKTK